MTETLTLYFAKTLLSAKTFSDELYHASIARGKQKYPEGTKIYGHMLPKC